jgi:hypothetical protein
MRKFISGCAATALAVGLATTAQAAERDAQFGTDEVLDAICVEIVNPSNSSDFTTYALDATSTEETIFRDVGSEYIVPLGNPITIVDGLSGPVHVNGYSPNIWAFHNRIVVYPDGAEVRINQESFVRTTRTATGCHVHKPGAGNSPQDKDDLHSEFNAPNGLQLTQALNSVSDGPAVPAGYRVVSTIPGPYEDPTQTVRDAQALICISPSTTTKKGAPGDWVAKNGYTGNLGGPCSRALWDIAFGNGTPPASDFTTSPSNSLPQN